MFNKKSAQKNKSMLTGSFARKGYDWWWHSFTGVCEETGEERAFFIDCFICNPKRGGEKPVLGQLPENKQKGIRPSYFMVKAGWWGPDKKQLHRFFGWKETDLKQGAPFYISAGDCVCSDHELRGSIKVSNEDAAAHPEYMCDGGEIKWDLRLDKQIAYNVGYGTSAPFRGMKAFEMYWHAEGMKTAYAGYVIADGKKFSVRPDTCYGYADKNWGRGFTSPWVWLSSNSLKSNITGEKLTNSVFDIGGGRPKIFFLALERKLLGAMYHEGKEYEFNFSKFWTGSKTEFSFDESEDEVFWHVKQETRKAIMQTEMSCKKADMIFVNYEAPDGSKRHNRLWNGGNGTGRILLYKKLKKGETELIDDIAVDRAGCEYGEYCADAQMNNEE